MPIIFTRRSGARREACHGKRASGDTGQTRYGTSRRPGADCLPGKAVRSGFVEFTLNGRVIRKCPCDEILTPILSRPLIHDNGASIRGKGTSFALSRLITHLRRFRKAYNTNAGCALITGFRKFFDSIDHAALFGLIDERVKEITRCFIPVSGNGKSPGPGVYKPGSFGVRRGRSVLVRGGSWVCARWYP